MTNVTNLFSELKKVQTFYQLDELTDITSMANVLVHVPYIYNNHVNEDLLFCQQLNKPTTGMDIFQKLDTFFIEMSL